MTARRDALYVKEAWTIHAFVCWQIKPATGERDTVGWQIVLVLDADDLRWRNTFLDPAHHRGENVMLSIEGQRRQLR